MTYRVSLTRLHLDHDRTNFDPDSPYRLFVETLNGLGLSDGADRIMAELSKSEALAVMASGIVERCVTSLPNVTGPSAPTTLEIRAAETDDPIMRWDLVLRYGPSGERSLSRLDGANARLLSEASGGKVALPEAMLREMEEARRAFDEPVEVPPEELPTPSI